MASGRREFVKGLLGGVAAATRGYTAPSERIVMGCIGVGRMGTGHVRGFLQHEDVRIVAVCDVQETARQRAKALVDAKYGDQTCATYNDFRELLARPDIDAVLIATPEHTHTIVGIEAARRGKHMYYEKPLGMSVAEAKALREAVNRTGVVFQFGTQQRSSRYYRHSIELVLNGRIGELNDIMICSNGGRYTRLPPEQPKDVPAGFDYDLWLGPAPWAPYSDLRVSPYWMEISDYGLGHIGGLWGVHDIDIAQWVNDADYTAPVSVEGTGLFFDDIRDTAYIYDIEYKYANGVRCVYMDLATAKKRVDQFKFGQMASCFLGTKGWVYVSREGMRTHPERLMQEVIGPNEKRVVHSDDHRRNFLNAVKTGGRPISHIEAAARDETICQMGQAAMKLGRKLRWDPVKEVFLDDAEANRMLSRAMRSPWRLDVPPLRS